MQVYQLKVNTDRTIICYIEAINNSETIKICNLKSDVKEELNNIEGVVFLEWLSRTSLLIQTKKMLITYNICSKKKINNIFLKDKIRMLLSKDRTYFDYVIQLTIDKIEVKRYYYLDGDIKEIMSFNTISKEVNVYNEEKFRDCYLKYKQKIFEILDTELGFISDNWNGNRLMVSNKNLECSIIVNDEVYFTGSGYIDNAYILDEYIIYSFSNFLSHRSVYKIMMNGSNDCFSVGQSNEKIPKSYFQLDNIEKKVIGDRKVPMVVIEPAEFKHKTVVYLHGGPDTYTRNEYINFVEPMIKKGIRIILVDYSGSISYGEAFYKKIFNNNGEEALKDIESVLIEIRNENPHIFIAGESFGGYLAIIAAMRFTHIITKSIAMNGFTDYRYQYIFSEAREVMTKYFNIRISKNNPIDFIDKISNISPLVIIHGVKDVYCPINQIEVFVDRLKKLNYVEVKLIKIEEGGHYSMVPQVMEHFYSYLIEEVSL